LVFIVETVTVLIIIISVFIVDANKVTPYIEDPIKEESVPMVLVNKEVPNSVEKVREEV